MPDTFQLDDLTSNIAGLDSFDGYLLLHVPPERTFQANSSQARVLLERLIGVAISLKYGENDYPGQLFETLMQDAGNPKTRALVRLDAQLEVREFREGSLIVGFVIAAKFAPWLIATAQWFLIPGLGTCLVGTAGAVTWLLKARNDKLEGDGKVTANKRSRLELAKERYELAIKHGDPVLVSRAKNALALAIDESLRGHELIQSAMDEVPVPMGWSSNEYQDSVFKSIQTESDLVPKQLLLYPSMVNQIAPKFEI